MKIRLDVWIFSSLFIFILGDPCIDYKTIDTWERSAANTYGSACDALLVPDWYRIISKAGELMPTECIVGGGRCGTALTVWLNGTYPEYGEIMNATACTSHYDGDCCFKSYDIQIKNCTDFYVHYLVPVYQCPQSYCFGTEVPCSVGETSENGFTPGCELDPCHVQNFKVLSGEVKRSSNFSYKNGLPIDDTTLKSGWYKFDSYVGNDIVNSIQTMNKCGTVYPVWMNGDMPVETRKTVNRTCCVSGMDNTCESTVNIQIRRCGTFNVYNLVTLRNSSSAYCIGSLPVREDTTQADTGNTKDNLNGESLFVGIVGGLVVCIVIMIISRCIYVRMGKRTPKLCYRMGKRTPSVKSSAFSLPNDAPSPGRKYNGIQEKTVF